ncbi:unnamed protein product [Hyaloperonospora brassicae]|uniref:Pectate lyase n=1 Tax=Hyaloperonospora brassicae TaxID=162125 RepID=A0AAV0TKZ9_HYABA|nr:unnamed protein product [Hyaloperonospora brassicae]CAI5723652.1 unnamed protein product [Hyaloperonospora brassicae]
MVNAISFVALVFAASAAVTSAVSMRAEAAPMPNGAWPSSQGDVKFAAPYTVKKGENEGDKVTVGGIKIKGKKVEVCSVGTGASRTSCNYSPSSVTYV